MSGAAAAPVPAPGAWSARLGLATAASVILAVLAAVWLGLEDPWWAALTAWRVMDAQPATMLSRSAQRLVGTVCGAALGLFGAAIAGDAMLVQAVLLFAVTAVGTWQRFASARWSYGWTLGSMTALLVLFASLGGVDGLYAFAVYRVLEIACGIAAAAVVEALLVPAGRPAPPFSAGGAPTSPPTPPEPGELVPIALLVGTAMLVIAILWGVLDLPAGVQTAVSAMIVVDRDAIRLRARGWQRLAGCVAGGGIGLGAIGLGLEGFLPWAAALGGGVFWFSAIAMGGGPNAYFGVQGGMAVITALVVGSGPPDQLEPVLERLLGIVIGVGVVLALTFVFAPRGGRGAAG